MRNEGLKILGPLFAIIAKGRVGVAKVEFSMNLKGSMHEYNRCINNLTKTLEQSKEKFNVSSMTDTKGLCRTNIYNDKFNLEIVNI
jgi:hypothetical protein